MSLNIDQLADLKIAIKKNEITLKENTKNNEVLENRNEDLTSTNKRLEQEINLQVDRIEKAKTDNQKLLEEKSGILSKFATDNEKVYKELREKEKNVSNDAQQTALRLIELDKREWKLANKENSNKALLEEARNTKKEASEEVLRVEKQIDNLNDQRKKLKQEEKAFNEKKEALLEVKKDLEDTKEDINGKESDLLELNQNNQNLLIEINAKEKAIISDKDRLEKLVPLFNELKDYVIENSNVTIEELEKLIPEKEEVIEEDTPEKEEVIFDITTATYKEMLAETEKQWIRPAWSPKKDDLIKLLTK